MWPGYILAQSTRLTRIFCFKYFLFTLTLKRNNKKCANSRLTSTKHSGAFTCRGNRVKFPLLPKIQFSKEISHNYHTCRLWNFITQVLGRKLLMEEKVHVSQECIPVGCVPPSAAVAVCRGGGCLPGGGGSGQGGCLPRGDVCQITSPPPWTEWQTPVKTLPCRNYVADGNKFCM